ncbi:DEAD/DEAH box helicase [Pseudoalteromonas lipolytica]|uniref:DEAD/DEAH box helicase n=1 Tax=Pseudoalteromonas lipolytica TaxID=570156 RepID=A0ABU8SVM5_9GAMM
MNKTLGNVLSIKANESEYFKELYSFLLTSFSSFKLKERVSFTKTEVTDLCRYADIFSNSTISQHRMLAYDIATKLLQIKSEDSDVIKIARSVFFKLGLFVTEESFLSVNKSLSIEKEIAAMLKKDLQKSDYGPEIFTDIQYHLLKQLSKEKVFSFSGPTSFGKSFIIKTLTLSLAEKGKNVVILVPTKALIDEFIIDIRTKLIELNKQNINLTKTASSYSSELTNVMVFTPERFNSLLFADEHSDIDCIIVDEAQKLGFNDERAITQFKVITKAIELNPSASIFFSSPVITNPNVFLETFELDKNKYEVIKESPVNQNLFLVDLPNSEISVLNGVTSSFEKINKKLPFYNKLHAIWKLSSKNESNLIYCTSKAKSISEARGLIKYLEIENCPDLERASNTIKKYIHDNYYLCDMLLYGVAYHNADLPNFIKDLIEELYRLKKIKYLFATSTLLEGVNLPTSNIFITSITYKKTKVNESKLNFWNLAGRAGRYTKELDGNIYCIQEEADKWKDLGKLIEKKQNIEVDSATLTNLSRGQKILNVLDKGDELPEKKEDRVFDQLMNLIISSYGEPTNKSILSLIPAKFHSKLIAKLKDKLSGIKDSQLPLKVLNSAHSIPLTIQKDAMRSVIENPIKLEQLMGDSVYEYVVSILNIYEPNLNDKQIKRYAVMASQWIDGETLKSMIAGSLKPRKDKMVYIDRQLHEYDQNDPAHINALINEVIQTIEKYLSFQLEVFSSHYFKCMVAKYGEKGAGQNLASFLELGTKNKKQMALQNYGFSRAASIEISNIKTKLITFNDDVIIKSIDLISLIKLFDKTSLAFREIQKFLK